MKVGRLARLRHRGSKLYVVEETIAALSEELEFTLNYAQAMTREESYRTAVEVIEEQRRSLSRAHHRMQRAVAAPEENRSGFRVRAALAGVAAALAIASGAFASFGGASHHSSENPRIQAIQQATAALTGTTAISDPLAFQAIAADAQRTILEVAQASPSDPAVQRTLLDSVERLTSVVRNPNVPARVREQAKRVAEKVKAVVIPVPDTPDSSTSGTDATPTPSASV